MDAEYDVIVVGAGLIGSAAARHLVEISSNVKVLLVGPEEPETKLEVDVFGAHYDEGRITRVLDPDPIWAELGRRSINRYRDIEQNSGITFYNEVGFLALGTKDGTYTSKVKATAQKLHQPVELFNHLQLQERFPYLNSQSSHEGVNTKSRSGHISPRNLVAAQTEAARRGGCNVINDVVRRVTAIGAEGYEIEAETSGRVIRTRKVLLAPGCFTECRNLLPANLKPLVNPMSTTVLRAEVAPSDLPRFRGMPSVISDGLAAKGDGLTAKGGGLAAQAERHPGHGSSTSDGGCYVLPPIKYPNGKYYMKIGHGFSHATVLHTPDQLVHWHRFGSHTPVKQFLMDSLHSMFPDMMFRDYQFDYCAVGLTPTEQLYIDMVEPPGSPGQSSWVHPTGRQGEATSLGVIEPGLGIVTGCCGYAAKSSDEIGRIAARMILKGSWDDDLPAERFKIRWKRQAQL